MGADSRKAFLDEFNVSRETMNHLDEYEQLLRKWNPAINLVSKPSLKNLWQRHFHDSAQIYRLRPDSADHWVDLGSGGGFPGLVLAILAADSGADTRFTLVESDTRKAVFLQTVIRSLNLSATVLAKRIEQVAPLEADILTARALAPLGKLLEYAEIHLKPQGVAFFPKGESYKTEIDEATSFWRFAIEEIPSKTNSNGAILKTGGISRV